MGGYGNDSGLEVGVDIDGYPYITGQTSSINFPVLNAFQNTLTGSNASFVTKLSSDGSSLVYSTYLNSVQVISMDVDILGRAYLTGTVSTNNLPIVNAFDSSFNGISDAFVTKISSDGSSLVYSTYLGGSGSDVGTAIVADKEGNTYVTGFTSSQNFPTVNSYNPIHGGGGSDAFVTKISSDGSSLVYSTYLGGNGNDEPNDMAIDDDSNVHLTGSTTSDNFPTINYYQKNRGGGIFDSDVFVTKLSNLGSSIMFSTYLGQSNQDSGRGVGVDGLGNIYIAGWTQSYDFPVFKPIQEFYAGNQDGFITKIHIVDNQPPIANAGTDQAINEGQQIAFDGSASSDPDGLTDIVSYEWSFGDGTTGNGITIEHTYLDNGVYTVTLVITDTYGISDIDEVVVIVNNVVPNIGPLSPVESVLLGVLINTNANFTDPGILDTHTAVFDWGDGTVSIGTLNQIDGSVNVFGSHTYSTSGSFTVSLIVTDKDNGTTTRTISVVILSTIQAINNLIDLVETFNLQQGILNSLDAKLDAAINALDDVNQNNDVAAINTLEAFINAVESQRDDKITSMQADNLISIAQAIIDYLLFE